MKRYEALAQELAQSIRDGMLKPGDKLPSVRQASSSRAVSPSTVFAGGNVELARHTDAVAAYRQRYGVTGA